MKGRAGPLGTGPLAGLPGADNPTAARRLDGGPAGAPAAVGRAFLAGMRVSSDHGQERPHASFASQSITGTATAASAGVPWRGLSSQPE